MELSWAMPYLVESCLSLKRLASRLVSFLQSSHAKSGASRSGYFVVEYLTLPSSCGQTSRPARRIHLFTACLRPFSWSNWKVACWLAVKNGAPLIESMLNWNVCYWGGDSHGVHVGITACLGASICSHSQNWKSHNPHDASQACIVQAHTYLHLRWISHSLQNNGLEPVFHQKPLSSEETGNRVSTLEGRQRKADTSSWRAKKHCFVGDH